MLKYIVVFDYLTYTLCYTHNGDASTQDYYSHNCKWTQYLWIAVCTRIPKIGYEYTPNGGERIRWTFRKGRKMDT